MSDVHGLVDRLLADRVMHFSISRDAARIGALGDGGSNLSIEDCRDQFWIVDVDEGAWVKFSGDRQAVVRAAEGEANGGLSRSRFLRPWRIFHHGEQLMIAVVEDAHTGGRLQIFRIEGEVHPGGNNIVEPPPRQVIDSAVNRVGLLAELCHTCSQIPISQLRAAIEVHRANFRQPECPVLMVMEARASEVLP